MTESNRVEYKRELTDGLEKEVVAFLNAREVGLLYIGLEIVEHLGSGVPRIVNAYGREAFEIPDSFIRIVFRFATSQPESQLAARIVALLSENIKKGHQS